MNSVSGVYQIQSKIKPERIYIGSSVNIQNRQRQHLQYLNKNNHDNNKLQNHFNKYGNNDLQFSLLLECDKEVLIHAEQAFLDYYKPYFNICKVAGSILGFKWTKKSCENVSKSRKGCIPYMKGKHHSKETKLKLRIINLGKKHSEETKQKIRKGNLHKIISEETKQKISDFVSKPIFQYDLQNNFIREWKSARQAAINLNMQHSHINNCCNYPDKHKTTGGYIWKYKNK